MTQPRRVLPGQTSLLTRRCTQREYLLRPDEEASNAFLYCLIEAAQKFNIKVLLAVMMSNHHHTVPHDPDGNAVEFRHRFHTHLARCINKLRGRWENMFSSSAPSVVELLDEDALVDKLVYTATNPVKDGLVEKVRHWPGPKFVKALLDGTPLRARRPSLFRKDGPMPEYVEMTPRIPPEVGDHDRIVARVRAGIAAVEEAYARTRAQTGRGVVGRRRILKQSWRDRPENNEPRRRLGPQVATRCAATRTAWIQDRREWLGGYREAYKGLLAGEPVVFPAGTYWLRRFANVRVAPLDPPPKPAMPK